MSQLGLAVISVLLLTAVRAQPSINETLPLRIDTVIIPGAADGPRSCPSNDILESAKNNITEAIELVLPVPESTPLCGGLGWRQVADLDMTRPSQQCPSPWVEVSSPARSCATSFRVSSAGCEGVTFSVSGGTYSRVCGRAVGYSLTSPDGFIPGRLTDIDGTYLDGVSLTYGSPRQHIWSFAAGHSPDNGADFRCPCDTPDLQHAPLPPSFVGDNYFCDGRHNGALWDAMDCTTACCTFNSPPYFNVTLPTPTSDDIEARICADGPSGDEDIFIGLLQLFVQ